VVADYDRVVHVVPPPPLQDEWLTGQEHQVRDEDRARLNQRRTQTVPLRRSNTPAPDLVHYMQPLIPPMLADTTSAGQLTTFLEGVEPYEDDVGITEHSETDAPEGAQQCTRSGRHIRPPN
jgi:hypothetical protein